MSEETLITNYNSEALCFSFCLVDFVGSLWLSFMPRSAVLGCCLEALRNTVACHWNVMTFLFFFGLFHKPYWKLHMPCLLLLFLTWVPPCQCLGSKRKNLNRGWVIGMVEVITQCRLNKLREALAYIPEQLLAITVSLYLVSAVFKSHILDNTSNCRQT